MDKLSGSQTCHPGRPFATSTFTTATSLLGKVETGAGHKPAVGYPYTDVQIKAKISPI